MKQKLFSGLSLLVFILCSSINAFAAPGDLDPTFGSGGKVFSTVTGMDPTRGMALQPDGKIIIVGNGLGADSTQDFLVIRLNADGTRDTQFGTNGVVRVPFDNFAVEFASCAAVQADGKILVAGSVEFGTQGYDFGLVRLLPSGVIDSSYGVGGKVKVNIGPDELTNDLALQADGKAVITGTTRPTPNRDVAVVRLSTDGSLDTTFNGTGKIFIGTGSSNNDIGHSVAVQPDGKIVIGGTNGDFLVIRLNTNGVPDSTFGFSGFVQTPMGTQNDVATSIAIQSDGRIVAGGSANSGSTDQIAFARYNSNGGLDSTFDGDGKVLLSPTTGFTSPFIGSALIQADGRIVGVGRAEGKYLLIRLTPDGGRDGGFGNAGVILQSVAPSFSDAVRGALRPDGRLVAVGSGSDNGALGYTAARFLLANSQPTAPIDFDGDAKTDLSIFRPGPGEWWYNRSSDGGNRAFQFGAGTDTIAPADFTGDGKTDVAFFRPSTGQWFVLRSEDFSFYAFPFGTNGDVPVPADYDADGKADAAVFRPSTLTWFIQKSGGGTDIIGFGAAGDVPTVADYDGDTKADIAIYRPNGSSGAGEWWVRRSSNASVFALQFGTPTDKNVQGDYTGDGKADIAFWRPSTGGWFVLRSEDFSFYSFPFGTNGDIPVPGDYDGDGKNDAGVFRQPGALWFVNKSNGGTLIQQFGIVGDIPLPSAFVR